ncbi:hypothetical protein ACM66T_01940 [Sulfurimonas sp. ST-25]|uniref:hypothetical protein n=1 Tax=Sulfurimonas sp. ST-25 TaxID=3400151 RepID=UPI003A8A2F01
MKYDDDDASAGRENPAPYDDDDDAAPRKKRPAKEESEEELPNEKRGYTDRERDMIEAWLKTHKPTRDSSEDEEE